MTIRRITPYLLTILLFVVIYWVTMIIPNKTLFLGYGLEDNEVTDNNKIQLHLYIFNYALALVLLSINCLEIFSTKQDKFWLRFLKSIATIFLVYFISHYIFKKLDTRIWNMHYYPRGTPANLWCLVTMILTSCEIIILEGMKKLLLLKFDKTDILKVIPHWLRLEKTG